MIVSKIYQGIGNQLFQYAFGKARAQELGVELKLDTTYYSKYSEVTQFGTTYKRDFGLMRFNISAKEATEEEINSILYPKGKSLFEKLRNWQRRMSKSDNKKFYVKETKFSYCKELKSIMDNTYVDGYFTNEKYFKNIRQTLLNEFTLKNTPNSINSNLITEILRVANL